MENLQLTLAPPFYIGKLYDKTPKNLKMHNCHVAAFDELVSLAPKQPGFLGLETKQQTNGQWVPTTFWISMKSLKSWKKTGDKKIMALFPDTELTNIYILKKIKVSNPTNPEKKPSFTIHFSNLISNTKAVFYNLYSRC